MPRENMRKVLDSICQGGRCYFSAKNLRCNLQKTKVLSAPYPPMRGGESPVFFSVESKKTGCFLPLLGSDMGGRKSKNHEEKKEDIAA